MPNFLLELFSEEIPARMQARATDDLTRLMLDGFKTAGLAHGAARAFATPRRLTLAVADLAAATDARREEVKGPRVDAPEKALEGFLRKTGLTRDGLEIREDKRGPTYFAVIEAPATPADVVVAELVPTVVRNFPWPKSMRWGAGDLRWVRPLRRILCLLGEGADAVAPAFDVDGIVAGRETEGHRFHTLDKKTRRPAVISVDGFEDYVAKLKRAKVLLDPSDRAKKIERDAKKIAKSHGLELAPDPALLREVAGLVEYPIALSAAIDPLFLDLPAEVLQTSMREHQKYFALREPAGGRVVRFVAVANIATKDGGAKILAGNERVLRARLADAKFFYDNDLSTPLERFVDRLRTVTFHNRLGGQGARVARIRALAGDVAAATGADAALVDRAAHLAKADLTTEMVGEFPELQGFMGRVYAAAQGEDPAVAAAIEDHYAPTGPSDAAPTAPVSVAVALADKLDQLAAFWAIGAKPTGSGDPFALRRAALGVIRIILEGDLRVDLSRLLEAHAPRVDADAAAAEVDAEPGVLSAKAQADLLAFIAERLKVWLRDQGVRHDVVDAVYARGGAADPAQAKARIDALSKLLGSNDGANLIAAYKRANNILAAEEAKDGVEYGLDPEPRFAKADAEIALFEALDRAGEKIAKAMESETYPTAMAAMAKLRGPLDAFFETVVVNDANQAVRRNRLCLLNRIRTSFGQVADFSVIEG